MKKIIIGLTPQNGKYAVNDSTIQKKATGSMLINQQMFVVNILLKTQKWVHIHLDGAKDNFLIEN